MEKYTWTPEADATIRRMIDEGAPTADICDALGCTDRQLENRLYVLRRQDPNYPRLKRGKHRATACSASTVEAVCTTEPETGPVPASEPTVAPKGELNPLEREMAAIIREQDQTILELRQAVASMEAVLRDYRTLMSKKDIVIARLAEAMYGEELS